MTALRWQIEEGVDWLTVDRKLDGAYGLRFAGEIEFRVSFDGTQIDRVDAFPVGQETIDSLYFNQVLPLALSRRGYLVLHAACVETDYGAVAFVGRSGQGKSTLAASFASNGCRFLADDGLQIETTDGAYIVRPSRPSIRLWDDSCNALLPESRSMAPPVDYTRKSRFLADQFLAFCAEPRKLRTVYFLGDGAVESPTITSVTPSEAMVELIRHAFLLDIEEREALSLQFAQLTHLVTNVKTYRLDYARRYDNLPAVRQLVLDHTVSI